ncbi:Flp pilus assembly protein TadG [Ochrobactrum sp. 19YEA23]|uniref:TadE family protein n=1 Tax=Ochrobactrum sp. 19YEA23 TaxID=3039854 RepID=UPI002478C91B|nr:Flp pilus assembly protein TadG [Ochrobactrum sp. 19YEA23]
MDCGDTLKSINSPLLKRRIRLSESLKSTVVFSSNKSGTAAVEFAILAPVFLLLLMGVIAFGIYLGAANAVQQLAADATRTALAGIDATERQTLATTYIQKNAAKYTLINATQVKATIDNASSDPSQFTVTISYNAANLPIWNLLTGLPLPGKTITRASTIRLGGT